MYGTQIQFSNHANNYFNSVKSNPKNHDGGVITDGAGNMSMTVSDYARDVVKQTGNSGLSAAAETMAKIADKSGDGKLDSWELGSLIYAAQKNGGSSFWNLASTGQITNNVQSDINSFYTLA